MTWQVINGSSAEILKTYPDNSFDCVVTDPPYGINFLGKAWDSNTGDREVYEQCLRVLKPGGHLLAFSAARTYHHLAMTVETVGFEIRDQIMWIYGSGFPKSQDVGRQIAKKENTLKNTKTYLPEIDDNRNVANSTTGSPRCQMCDKSTGPIWKKCPDDRPDCIRPWEPDLQDNKWSGWGTQLKPAHEPIVMARKPVIGSIRENVLEHSTGAINIDATRVTYGDNENISTAPRKAGIGIKKFSKGDEYGVETTNDELKADGFVTQASELGRFPANVIGEIDEPYQKYFYCPKVSRSERHIGHDKPPAMFGDVQGCYGPDGKRMAEGLDNRGGGNNHPTVKPIELMKYLIKLVTPPNGHILDPFNGSGSTGCAAVELGYNYTGIELDPNYVDIATKRISHWESECKPKTTYNELFNEV